MIRLSYELMSATLPDLQIKTVLSFLQAYSTTLLEFSTSVFQSTDRDACRSAECYFTAINITEKQIQQFSMSFLKSHGDLGVTTELRKK